MTKSLHQPSPDDDYTPRPDAWEEGYHYTSWTNWTTIQKIGLLPTRLSQDKLRALDDLVADDWDGKAVWIWAQRLSPKEHMGSCLYQLAKRAEPHVVCLKVKYRFEQLLAPRPELKATRLGLRHNGKIDDFIYHEGTRSYLSRTPIPPNCCELVATYDLISMFALTKTTEDSPGRHPAGVEAKDAGP